MSGDVRTAAREIAADPRQYGASILVAAIAALFGVGLVDGVALMRAWLTTHEWVVDSGTAMGLLQLSASIFFVVALFVAAMVISNTFGIIVAGRTGRLAMLRLIGASAGELRRSITWEGAIVGVIGAIVGSAIGLGTVAAIRAVMVSLIPAAYGEFLSPVIALPAVLVVAVTTLAAFIGSRRVLAVTPLAATSVAVEASTGERRAEGVTAVSIGALGFGTGLIAIGVAIGFAVPLGVFVALAGGVLSFIGFALGSSWLMPPLQRVVCRVFGRPGAARIAADALARHPARTGRTTMSLVIGVTLVVMFAAAALNLSDAVDQSLAADTYRTAQEKAEIAATIDTLQVAIGILLAFSVAIALVGLGNALALSVLQRTREIGLLRAVGLSRRATRRMVMAEAALQAVTALAVGSVLGVLYGWAGAESMLAGLKGVGWLVPRVPWVVVAGAVVVGLAAVTLASLGPARRAVRIEPTTALGSP